MRKVFFFHVDATQSCGKLVDEIRHTKYTMLSLSAHKFNGPQGIGALVLRKKRYKLPPVKAITYGGQQEHGIRPGTIPVALVAGLGKACEIANGSACTSNDYSPSYVLTAMGLDKDVISSAIRISWGSDSNKDQILESIGQLIGVAKSLAM